MFRWICALCKDSDTVAFNVIIVTPSPLQPPPPQTIALRPNKKNMLYAWDPMSTPESTPTYLTWATLGQSRS